MKLKTKWLPARDARRQFGDKKGFDIVVGAGLLHGVDLFGKTYYRPCELKEAQQWWRRPKQ